MKLENLDLNLLALLEALYEEKSVSRAGGRLGLSQSATSSALGRLRAYFGDELFLQTGRRLEPTALAMDLRAPVLDVLAEIRSRILRPTQTDLTSITSTLRISVADDIVPTVLAPALRRFLADAPRVRVRLQALDGQLVEALERHLTDVVISHAPRLAAELSFEEIFRDEYVVVGAPLNPLFEAGALTLASFSAADHVTIGFPRRGMSRIDEMLIELGVGHRTITVETPSFLSVPSLLAETRRIAVLPGLVARYFARAGRVAIAPLPLEMPGFAVSAQWREQAGTATLMRALVRRMREVAQESGSTPGA